MKRETREFEVEPDAKRCKLTNEVNLIDSTKGTIVAVLKQESNGLFHTLLRDDPGGYTVTCHPVGSRSRPVYIKLNRLRYEFDHVMIDCKFSIKDMRDVKLINAHGSTLLSGRHPFTNNPDMPIVFEVPLSSRSTVVTVQYLERYNDDLSKCDEDYDTCYKCEIVSEDESETETETESESESESESECE